MDSSSVVVIYIMEDLEFLSNLIIIAVNVRKEWEYSQEYLLGNTRKKWRKIV
jgi:hypothetical protein